MEKVNCEKLKGLGLSSFSVTTVYDSSIRITASQKIIAEWGDRLSLSYEVEAETCDEALGRLLKLAAKIKSVAE